MLTPEGAVQHIKNGKIFQKAYIEKHKLFLPSSLWKQIKVVSTDYPGGRTYQSAIALLYGFFPNIDPKKLDIAVAVENNMCTQDSKISCDCPKVEPYKHKMSFSFGELEVFTPNVRRAYKQITDVFDISEYDLPFGPSTILSTVLINICHGLPLPGFNNKCIPPRSILDLVTFLTENGRHHQEAKQFKSLMTLKMIPLVQTIYESIVGLHKNTTNMRFILYSGHDTTVDPLMTVLGIADGTWPRYATRIVIETYSKIVDEQRQYFQRYLLNGVDVTLRIVFCKNVTKVAHGPLCPLQKLKDFLHHIYPNSAMYSEQCAE